MAQQELTGQRDMIYSAWHRRESTRRFIGLELAQGLAMIDIDVSPWVEYDDGSKAPLFLVETALDIGQEYKCATVLRNLGREAKLPVYVVLYTPSATRLPCDERHFDIREFRVRRVHRPDGYVVERWDEGFIRVSPLAWARHESFLRHCVARRIDIRELGYAPDGLLTIREAFRTFLSSLRGDTPTESDQSAFGFGDGEEDCNN